MCCALKRSTFLTAERRVCSTSSEITSMGKHNHKLGRQLLRSPRGAVAQRMEHPNGRYPEETAVARTTHTLLQPEQTLDALREGQDLLLLDSTHDPPGILKEKIGPITRRRRRGSLIGFNFVIHVPFYCMYKM